MTILNLPICPVCRGSCRYVRRDQRFKCQYCDFECDRVTAQGLYRKEKQLPQPQYDVNDLGLFNRPVQAPQQATATTQAGVYHLRDEK